MGRKNKFQHQDLLEDTDDHSIKNLYFNNQLQKLQTIYDSHKVDSFETISVDSTDILPTIYNPTIWKMIENIKRVDKMTLEEINKETNRIIDDVTDQTLESMYNYRKKEKEIKDQYIFELFKINIEHMDTIKKQEQEKIINEIGKIFDNEIFKFQDILIHSSDDYLEKHHSAVFNIICEKRKIIRDFYDATVAVYLDNKMNKETMLKNETAKIFLKDYNIQIVYDYVKIFVKRQLPLHNFDILRKCEIKNSANSICEQIFHNKEDVFKAIYDPIKNPIEQVRAKDIDLELDTFALEEKYENLSKKVKK